MGRLPLAMSLSIKSIVGAGACKALRVAFGQRCAAASSSSMAPDIINRLSALQVFEAGSSSDDFNLLKA